MTGRRVSVTIGRVGGAAPGAGPATAGVLRAALAARLAAPGALAALRAGGAVARLDGGALDLGKGDDAALGRALAAAVTEALRR
jgi:hypothetical protein